MSLKRKATNSSQVTKKAKLSYNYTPLYTTLKTPKAELKYDIGGATTTPSGTGTIFNILSIASGSGANERIGRAIHLHSLHYCLRFESNANSLKNATTWMMVYDRQPNGVVPAFTDVFDVAQPDCQLNPAYGHRFEVLCRHSYSHITDSTGQNYENTTQQLLPKVVSLKGKSSSFIGTGSTIAAIERGAIYIACVSTDGTTDCYVREKIVFYDM